MFVNELEYGFEVVFVAVVERVNDDHVAFVCVQDSFACVQKDGFEGVDLPLHFGDVHDGVFVFY